MRLQDDIAQRMHGSVNASASCVARKQASSSQRAAGNRPHLAGLDPRDARLQLSPQAAQAREHCPAAMDELALAETLQAKHLQPRCV
jgi:hypothetical protein